MQVRPRRNRRNAAIRGLVRETQVLAPGHLVQPLFVQDGEALRTEIPSMPGQARLSIDLLVETAHEAHELGIPGVALFPGAPGRRERTPAAAPAPKPEGLLQRAIRALKARVPELLVITDVALDPYSSDGHDGVVIDGRIDNDETLPLLAGMALTQAEAGADIVAPSDMMDGRVGVIRERPRRRGLHRDRHRRLLRQVRLGVLRALPRRPRLRAQGRRQEDLPDGSGQRARGPPRARARRGGRAPIG